jgi:hypothetical protein
MTEFWNSVVTIVIATIGIAGLAVLVSKQANTSQVLGAGGQAVSGLLQTALSPVTGAVGTQGLAGGFGFQSTGANFL